MPTDYLPGTHRPWQDFSVIFGIRARQWWAQWRMIGGGLIGERVAHRHQRPREGCWLSGRASGRAWPSSRMKSSSVPHRESARLLFIRTWTSRACEAASRTAGSHSASSACV